MDAAAIGKICQEDRQLFFLMQEFWIFFKCYETVRDRYLLQDKLRWLLRKVQTNDKVDTLVYFLNNRTNKPLPLELMPNILTYCFANGVLENETDIQQFNENSVLLNLDKVDFRNRTFVMYDLFISPEGECYNDFHMDIYYGMPGCRDFLIN